MTRETFFAHKAGIAEAMNQALMISKYQGKALHKYCEAYDTITVRVLSEDKNESKIGKLQEVTRYCELYGAPSISELTERPVCTSYFIGTAYSFKVPRLRNKIEEAQIAQQMRTLVRKALGLTSMQNLECKVMALFKEGYISWEEVLEQHGKACTL